MPIGIDQIYNNSRPIIIYIRYQLRSTGMSQSYFSFHENILKKLYVSLGSLITIILQYRIFTAHHARTGSNNRVSSFFPMKKTIRRIKCCRSIKIYVNTIHSFWLEHT